MKARFLGRSPDGQMEFQITTTVRVMPPRGGDGESSVFLDDLQVFDDLTPDPIMGGVRIVNERIERLAEPLTTSVDEDEHGREAFTRAIIAAMNEALDGSPVKN